MGFEIQIWVLYFGREVEYTKIRRNEFSLCTAHFLMNRQNGNKTDICKKKIKKQVRFFDQR